MTGSVRQWKRQAQVVVGKSGKGVSITEKSVRIKFEITKTTLAAPNNAIIQLYNLSPDNEHAIKNEYDEVLLNAGYEGGVLLVFRGNIKHVYRYRDGNDFITEIEAGDGDKDYRQARMNETLAAGTTPSQLIDRVVGSFSGTTRGTIQAGGAAYLRGKVISGNTRDVLDDHAQRIGANWSIQDGQLTLVGVNAVAPGTAILVTSETGLLGAPEINDKGIAFKCLLNPQIKPNVAVKLDNSGIRAKRQQEQASGKKPKKPKNPVRLDPDGIYKTIKLKHVGDTRGPDWFSEVTCIGLDQPIPPETTGAEEGDLEDGPI